MRAVDAAAGDIVLGVESLRATLRHALTALDELARDRPAVAPPSVPATSETRAATKRDEKIAVGTDGLRVMRIREVAGCIGLSRATIWRLQREGRFPKQRRLSSNAVGWLAEEVEEWIRTRAGRS